MKIQGYSANQPLSSTEQVQNSNQQAGNTASTRQAATLQDDVISPLIAGNGDGYVPPAVNGTSTATLADDVVSLSGDSTEGNSPLVFGSGNGHMPPDPD